MSFSVSSCNFSSIWFTVSTCEGFLYVFGLEISFENLTDLGWLLNFVICGWLLVVWVDCSEFIYLFLDFNFPNFLFMSCHISIRIWALVLNVVCMAWSECYGFSVLVPFGLGQSFTKWSSLAQSSQTCIVYLCLSGVTEVLMSILYQFKIFTSSLFSSYIMQNFCRIVISDSHVDLCVMTPICCIFL